MLERSIHIRYVKVFIGNISLELPDTSYLLSIYFLEFEEDEIPANADSFVQDRNNNVPSKMEFDSTLILTQWNLDFPETKLIDGQNEGTFNINDKRFYYGTP